MATSTSSSESVFCGAKPMRMVIDLRKRLKVSTETRDHSFLFDKAAKEEEEEEEEEYDGLEGGEPVTQMQQLGPARKRTVAHFLEPSPSEPTKEATERFDLTEPVPEVTSVPPLYIKLLKNKAPILVTPAYDSTVSFAKDHKPAGQDPINMAATDCRSTISDTLQTQKKHRVHGPGQPVAVGRHQKLMSEHLKAWAASRAHGNTSPACSMGSSITTSGCSFQLGAQAATNPSSAATSVAPSQKLRLAREEYRFLKIIIPGQRVQKADSHHQYAHRKCISRDEAVHDCCTWRTCGDDSAPSLS